MAGHVWLADRSAVTPGIKANLCRFDPARIVDRATYDDPRQLPDGVAWVFVNGEPVLHDRELTGLLPGTLPRWGSPAATST